MRERPPKPIVVFDVNETLLDITTLEPLFERLFEDRSVLRTWFAELILYAQAVTLSGVYTPFGELAVGTLKMVATFHNVEIGEPDIAELKSRMAMMPAHPDVRPALDELRNHGFRMVTLTNSSGAATPTPLEHAGLGGYFEQSFSVDAVRKFKPAPEVYQHVARELGVETSDLCMVACHLWDTMGAQSAGCHGAFVARPHNAVLPVEALPAPTFTSHSLDRLATQIVSHWNTN